ncbi:MAG TPA: hypothetical protein VHC41_08200 [Mycobacteriales bacterium]|nr:hypothetical protein [Mycobacteriales bacterium]
MSGELSSAHGRRRLAGRRAVVTGSGGAIALRPAQEGADIALNDRRPGATEP